MRAAWTWLARVWRKAGRAAEQLVDGGNLLRGRNGRVDVDPSSGEQVFDPSRLRAVSIRVRPAAPSRVRGGTEGE
jgi:hypothetical protein